MKKNVAILLIISLCNVNYTIAQGGSLRKVDLNDFAKIQESKNWEVGKGSIYKFKYTFRKDYATTKSKEKYGILDRNNREIFPPILHDINFRRDILKFIVKATYPGNGSSYCGILDTSGHWVVKPSSTDEIIIPASSEIFANGMVANDKVIYYHKKYIEALFTFKLGAVDNNGNTVIPFKYDGFEMLNYGFGKISIGSKKSNNYQCALVDSNGKLLTKVVFDDIRRQISEDLYNQKGIKYFPVQLLGKYGFINESGTIAIPIVYDDYNIDFFNNNSMFVKKDNMYGMIDFKGNTKIPFEYEKIENLSGSYYLATKDAKKGMIDINGKQIIPIVYTELEVIGNGMALAAKDYSNYGVVNTKGEVIVPLEYDKFLTKYDLDLYKINLNNKEAYGVFIKRKRKKMTLYALLANGKLEELTNDEEKDIKSKISWLE